MATIYVTVGSVEFEIELDAEGLLMSAKIEDYEINPTETQRAKLQKLARNAALKLIEEAQTEAAILNYQYRRAAP